MNSRERWHIEANRLFQRIVEQTGYAVEELHSRNRCRRTVDKRRVVVALMYRHHIPLSEIGRQLRRSHADVIHLLQTAHLVQAELDAAAQKLESRRPTD